MPATVLQLRSAAWEEAETCCVCGVEFASPVIRKRRDDAKTFWCPNGHSQSYSKSTEQKLREELQAERAKKEQAQREVEWAKAEAKGARIAEGKAKARLKRVKTRIHAGVCDCCNRTFQNLARHMATKHPEIKKEN